MIYIITHQSHPGSIAKVRVDEVGLVTTLHADGATFIARLLRNLPLAWTGEVHKALEQDGFVLKAGKEVPTNVKLALWCRLYKEYKGIAYKTPAFEVGKMKALSINEAMLRFYLDDAKALGAAGWLWKGKQTISNLVIRQNEVRAAMVAPEPSNFINHYDREYEKKLDGPAITAYRQHLRSLGLVGIKDRSGAITDYRKPNE